MSSEEEGTTSRLRPEDLAEMDGNEVKFREIARGSLRVIQVGRD